MTYKWQWNLVKSSILIFPLMGELGGLGLLIVAFNVCWLRYKQIINYPLNWVLGIFCIWLIFTSLISEYPQEAFLGIANFIPFFLLFISLTQFIKTPCQLRELAWRFILGAIPVIFLGFSQLFLGWEIPSLLTPLINWLLTPYGNPPGRMSSVFMYANLLALYLLIILILALGLWCDRYFIWRRNKTKINGLVLAIITIILVADSWALILTNSRNAWGLSVLAIIAFTIYLGWYWILQVISFIILMVSGAAWGPSPIQQWLRGIVPAFFWARLSDQMYADRPLETLRITQWQFVMNMTIERPLTGWGLRNFTPLYREEMGIWLGHPHNLFLMLLGEVGIIGTALFCYLVSWIIWQTIKLIKLKNVEGDLSKKSDKLILFSYLIAFLALSLFNCFDVTVLDGKSNTIGWFILTAISGIVYHDYLNMSKNN